MEPCIWDRASLWGGSAPRSRDTCGSCHQTHMLLRIRVYSRACVALTYKLPAHGKEMQYKYRSRNPKLHLSVKLIPPWKKKKHYMHLSPRDQFFASYLLPTGRARPGKLAQAQLAHFAQPPKCSFYKFWLNILRALDQQIRWVCAAKF